MNAATRISSRGTALVNMPAEPTQGTAKGISDWGEAAGQFAFGFGSALSGVGNIVGAITGAELGRTAISAAERQAQADRMAKAQRQEKTIAFLAKLTGTAAILFVLYLILR